MGWHSAVLYAFLVFSCIYSESFFFKLHKSTELSWSTLPTANTKLKTINCCTPQQKGNAHHINKRRGIPNHPHQSSEGPISPPGGKGVQDSEMTATKYVGIPSQLAPRSSGAPLRGPCLLANLITYRRNYSIKT